MTQTEPTSPTHEQSPDSPRLRRRIPFVLCVLLAMVLMFGNYIIALPLTLIPGTAELAERSLVFGTIWQVVLSVITLLTALVLVSLATKYVLRGRLRDVGLLWTKDSWWLFLLGWAASLVTVVGCIALLPLTGWVHHTPVPPEEWQKLTVGLVISTIVMKIAAAVALQGLPEELVWRGWLMHCLERRPRTALVVSAVVFGAMHIVSNGGQENFFERLVYVLQAMGFAFCAGALALRFRSLWAAIGVHSGLHLSNLILNFTPLNATGPVIWTATTIVWVAIGLIALAGWKGNRVELTR